MLSLHAGDGGSRTPHHRAGREEGAAVIKKITEHVEWREGDEFEIDPQDGGGPFVYWWDDMRPREVKQLVIEAYERGMARMCREKKPGQTKSDSWGEEQ